MLKVRGTLMIRKVLLGAGAIALLAGTTAPAAAQVGDFFCSSFSVFCPDPPPPPPPPLPMAEPAPEPMKHRARKHKVVKKVKKEAAEPAAAPAPQ